MYGQLPAQEQSWRVISFLFAEMHDIVGRIREHDEPLADEPTRLVDGFCNDEILALIEQAGGAT